MALVYGVMNLPVAFWLLSSFVRRLPEELEDAARIDGAGYGSVLFRITVPLLMPGIISTGIICLILAYNEFLLASFLTRSESTQTSARSASRSIRGTGSFATARCRWRR